MINKLAAKALGEKKPAAKSKVSTKVPADPAPPLAGTALASSGRKIGGLPEERYYRAEGALRDMARAAEIKEDKGLHADMHKVANHKKAEFDRALGGGLKKK